MRAPASIPVFVIGGYLGAGKTTLLNALLRNARGVRYAVLVNDFGSVNLDAELIASAGGQTIELTNGCTCCTIGGDLILALRDLLARDVPPDRVVIEASGVANPAAVVRLAAAHPSLAVRGAIVVADAGSIRERAADRYVGGLVRRQLACAETLVLTKTETLDAAQRTAVRAWLEHTSPNVPIVESRAGDGIDVALLFEGRAIAGSHDVAPDEPVEHSALFRSVTFRSATPLDRAAFRQAVRAMIPAIARAKGIVRFADAPEQREVFQLAGTQWSLEPRMEEVAGETETRVVLIAVAEDEAALANGLRALQAAAQLRERA